MRLARLGRLGHLGGIQLAAGRSTSTSTPESQEVTGDASRVSTAANPPMD